LFFLLCSQLPHNASQLSAAAAIKLLWVAAVLGEADQQLQVLLLQQLEGLNPRQLSQQQLRMLYQAHRLTSQNWLQGNLKQQQQQQGEEDNGAAPAPAMDLDLDDEAYEDTEEDKHVYSWQQQQQASTTPFVVVIGGSGSDSTDTSTTAAVAAPAGGAADGQWQQRQQPEDVEGGFTLHDLSKPSSSSSSSSSRSATSSWPPRLVAAAEAAAAHFAVTSATRSKQQQLHVQDIFDDLGFEAPLKGLRLDGGALQPDLALIAYSSKARRSRSRSSSSSTGDIKDDGAAAAAAAEGLKVAIMCDHAGRYSRNAPHQLLGYEIVTGWLLEQAGWRVVRLAPHEWRLLLSDRGVEEGTAMAYLYNTLAAQGVVL
jgi:hypothetical protein